MPAPPPRYGAPPCPPAPSVYAYAPKSKGTALLLEILIGFFGILGIGWLYAGQPNTGMAWLLGYLGWNVVAVILDICTFGIFALIHLPVNIACLVISAVTLNNYTNQHPELFGA